MACEFAKAMGFSMSKLHTPRPSTPRTLPQLDRLRTPAA
jgi:hypothetical protein